MKHIIVVLFLFYLTTCVCVCLLVHGPLRECLRAMRFRASLLLRLHLCPAVLGALAVWIQNQNKNKNSVKSLLKGHAPQE